MAIKMTQEEADHRLRECQEKYQFKLLAPIPFKYINAQQQLTCKCLICGGTFNRPYKQIQAFHRDCNNPQRKKRPSIDKSIEKLSQIAKEKHYKFTICEKSYNKEPFFYDTRVDCECLVCRHKWQTSYRKLYYNRQGCSNCAGHLIPPQGQLDDTLAMIANGRYTFAPIEKYRGVRTKLECECTKCHRKWASCYHNLFRGTACKNRCYIKPKYASAPEREIANYIKARFPALKVECNSRSVISPYELDIFLPQIRYAIEFDGNFWHSDRAISRRFKGKFETAEQYHKEKDRLCVGKNIKLQHIGEREYSDNKQIELMVLDYNIRQRIFAFNWE